MSIDNLRKQVIEVEAYNFTWLEDCPICDDVTDPSYNGPPEVTEEILAAHEEHEV